jgi:hypothetical protein
MSGYPNRILLIKGNRRRKKSISLNVNGSSHQFNYNDEYLSTNLVKIIQGILSINNI